MKRIRFTVKNMKWLLLEVRICIARARLRCNEFVLLNDPRGREKMAELGMSTDLSEALEILTERRIAYDGQE